MSLYNFFDLGARSSCLNLYCSGLGTQGPCWKETVKLFFCGTLWHKLRSDVILTMKQCQEMSANWLQTIPNLMMYQFIQQY